MWLSNEKKSIKKYREMASENLIYVESASHIETHYSYDHKVCISFISFHQKDFDRPFRN